MSKEIGSVCTYCGVGCDITAIVKDNQIQKIYARSDGYVSQGKLCIKGKVGYDFVSSDKRVRKPLIKKEFIKNNFEAFPRELKARSHTLVEVDDSWYESSYEFATSLSAWKLSEIKYNHGGKSICGIGGARTSCESGYLFQKFIRQTLQSPHIDNCARVCHSPSLKGLKTVVGEGAASNPYDDIYKSEFLLIIGSNTTEAHPIIANRMIEAKRHGTIEMAVCDVRTIQLHKFADTKVILPYEANLMFLNMISYVILSEELYDKEFINDRVKGFDEYKKSILEDEKANPNFIKELKGYEELEAQIYKIARNLASKKSLIFWGLGVTEHLDGSKAVMAIANLALITGNIGKDGAGLMPLRGQNNVQGACDVGCLPYYLPDYQTPLQENIGLTTPELIDEMIDGNIKAIYNMGEDLLHIHPNQNKIQKAIQNLDLIIVQELFMNEIAKEADIVFGVKSAYEKKGVYVNAMRRLHLSTPLVKNSLPDDWEVIRDIENKINGNFLYEVSEDVWNDTRAETTRFAGASYIKLKKHTSKGLQWPVTRVDTPMLHTQSFATEDGFGHLSYYPYELRNQVNELINSESKDTFYLTTGRTLVQYNNSAQTMHTTKLDNSYSEDIVLACIDDKERIKADEVILKSKYGQSSRLKVKFSKKIKKGTLFTTFHKADSRINYLFGDESDNFTKTACFKSIEVEIN